VTTALGELGALELVKVKPDEPAAPNTSRFPK